MNIEDLIRDNVKALKPYSSARDEYKNASKDLVFLDANENPFNNGVNRYPDPQQNSIKDILAHQKSIARAQILLGNGSDEVLDLIFRAFCNPNEDNIITLPPTYGMYEVLANINAVEVIKVNLSETFQPQVDDILEAANTFSKILFLCSPNNPTGNSFKTEDIEKLLKLFKGIIVIDEAYIDFSDQKSWLQRLEEFPNLIVTQTLSKAYGMAGIRLGICYASKVIISVLNKIKPPYNVNELTQQKAKERLSNLKDVKREIQSILEQRDWLYSELEGISFIETIYPSEANFILLKVDDATKRYSELIESGIVIRNRTNQTGCNNCLRFTVGSQIENIKLIRALKTLQ
ncbi:MAG: histidinol-phosphate transaminase [Bacteroidetes bacterium]|nr:MAG: histidinol-phosphate transaminase [Bacteroidota bacterium]